MSVLAILGGEVGTPNEPWRLFLRLDGGGRREIRLRGFTPIEAYAPVIESEIGQRSNSSVGFVSVDVLCTHWVPPYIFGPKS